MSVLPPAEPRGVKRKKVRIVEEDAGEEKYREPQIEETRKRKHADDSDPKEPRADIPDLDDIILPFRNDIEEKQMNDNNPDAILAEMRNQADAIFNEPPAITLATERPIPLCLNPFEGKDEYEEEKSTEPDFCFFCWCSMSRSNLLESVLYKSFKGFVEQYWGWAKDPVWLMNRAQELYNVGVRKNSPRDMPFYRRMIFQHFLAHEKDRRFYMERRLMAVDGILEFIEQKEILKENISNPSIQRCNWAAVDRYQKLCAYADKLHEKVMKCRVGGAML